MKPLPILLAVLALIGGAVRPLPAQELSLDEIAQLARRQNLPILKAERALREAEADLKGEPLLRQSELSLGGDYSYTFASAADSLGAEAALSLPLLPQLSLEGTIGARQGDSFEEMSKELALTAYPFARADPLYPRRQAYDKAEASLRYLRQQVGLDAEQAALSLEVRKLERELARKSLELEERKSALAEARLQRGEISFQDAQDQQVALSEARQGLFSSELNSLRDRKALQVLFAPGTGELSLSPLSLEQLRSFVEARGARIAALGLRAPSSLALETLRLDLAALRSELAATPAWRPEASVSATLGLPAARTPREQVFSLRLDLTLSPGQRRDKDRLALEQDIAEKELEIRAEIFALELEKRLAVQSIAIAEQALAASLLQQQRDSTASREAELLFQQGKRTVLERDQLALNLQRDRIESFRAAVSLYGTQGQLLRLYVGGPAAP